jgi:hypothetical protein
MESIPRVSRAGVDLWWAGKAYRPSPVRRPIAHVLTLLDFTADGPTYSFECRADAGDLDKTCAAWLICECEPPRPSEDNLPDEAAFCPKSLTGRHEWRDGFCWRPARGCAYTHADAEDTDDAIRTLISEHDLRRGIYFVEVTRSINSAFDLTVELLAEMRNVVGSLASNPAAITVRPTDTMRYPGYGPEVDVRELIEEALSDTPDAITWDDEELTVTVDASEAARQTLAWVERTYDIPPDQLSYSTLPARIRKPDDMRRHGVVSLPTIGDVL